MTAHDRAGGAGEPPPGRLDAETLPRPHRVLDVVGLFCPVPIIRTAAEVRRLDPGRILEVVADDPVALVDLPNWCSGSGHDYLGWIPGAGLELRLFLRVGVGSHPGRVAPS